MSLRFFALLSGLAIGPSLFAAEALSRSYGIDFYRDVPSRNLKGLAAASDGRLVAGPELRDLQGGGLPELLWTLEPAPEGRWLVGTGPDGKIVEITLNSGATEFTAREIADLDEPQVLALRRLQNGDLLAGTSPNGALFLIRDGKPVARVGLPVDSIFDIVVRSDRAYVATGNPGRIYEIDLAKFASAGVASERIREAATLAAKGIRQFGEIRDRNVRRLVWLENRLIAGSSPRGNIYSFSEAGAGPEVMQENRDAEVAALLPQPNGDLFAAVVFAALPGENRINRPKPDGTPDTTPAAPSLPPDRFGGRSAVVYFPKNGYPETIVARPNLAFYALARRGDTLIIAGGEQGDILGYDLASRQSLSFAGSDSAQVNAVAPLTSSNKADPVADRFLALRNNAPGLAVIDFASTGPRTAETRRLDLGVPSQLGALRLPRLKNAAPEQVQVELRTNLGSDEIEGWSAWSPTDRRADGWMGKDLRARNVKVRISVKDSPNSTVEIDDAFLFYLPQNRRPQLTEFRILPPNYSILPAPEPNPTVVTTLNQLINAPAERDDKRRTALLNSQVIPQPGMQIVTWNVTDPDGDAVACTFSIRREGAEQWTDIVVKSRDGYVQFDTGHLEDGIYSTRLQALELEPRPAADRLTTLFETGDLMIDHTAPTLAEFSATRESEGLRIRMTGRDAFSLLEGAEVVLNNGYREVVRQPLDGIRDSQTETFTLLIPAAQAANATSVEVTLYDAVGNSTSRRSDLPK